MAKAKGVHRFIATQAMNQYMFGFVSAYRKAFPACSIERALSLFKSHFGLPDQDWNMMSMKRQYIRMEEDFINYLQHEPEPSKVDS